MITYLTGDLFEHLKEHKPCVIAHVCNNQGVMGSGFALQLKKTIPLAYNVYLERYKNHTKTWYSLPLGEVIWATQNDGLRVANMVAQTLENKKRNLRYDQLCVCMETVGKKIYDLNYHSSQSAGKKVEWTIVAPKFGSDRAGGNWEFIEELIKDIWERIDVKIFTLEK